MFFKHKAQETERRMFGVSVFTRKNKRFYANTLLDGKIHLEERALKKFSSNGLKTVVMHERFHQRWYQNPLSKAAVALGYIVPALSLIGIVAVLLILFYVHPTIAWTLLCLVALGYFISVGFLLMYLQRLQEAAADLYSAKELGKNKFVSGFEERYSKYPSFHSEKTLLDRLRNWRYFFEHRTRKERVELVRDA